MQLASKMGLISLEKSILWFAGGGNCASCCGEKVAARAGEQKKRKIQCVRRNFIAIHNLFENGENNRGKKTVAGEAKQTANVVDRGEDDDESDTEAYRFVAILGGL